MKSGREKSLFTTLKKHAGRDRLGHISVRHQGGGAKRLYRFVDFSSGLKPERGEVVRLEYDPNRTANIALVKLADGSKKYVLAPVDIKAGQTLEVGGRELTSGNRMRLRDIPQGTPIHSIEYTPGGGAKVIRAAGTAGTIMSKEEPYAHVRLPSGEIRKFHLDCAASIGQIGNLEHARRRIKKAGIVRHMGRRPTVRGKAMHPAAHPHGGGEGVNPIGLTHPKTPWGKHARGVRTRRRKPSDRFIIKRRK